MVLDFINPRVGENNLSLSIEEIAEIVGTTMDGTVFNDVNKINRDKRILQTVPSIEFVAVYEHHTLEDIENELKENKPVIAWISGSETGAREMQHSVVITNLDRDNYTIQYNDPIDGDHQRTLGDFISLWDSTDRTLIRVKIGEREQRLIVEYGNEQTGPSEAGMTT